MRKLLILLTLVTASFGQWAYDYSTTPMEANAWFKILPSQILIPIDENYATSKIVTGAPFQYIGDREPSGYTDSTFTILKSGEVSSFANGSHNFRSTKADVVAFTRQQLSGSVEGSVILQIGANGPTVELNPKTKARWNWMLRNRITTANSFAIGVDGPVTFNGEFDHVFMTIDTSGNVEVPASLGVGITPTSPLHVSSPTQTVFNLESTVNYDATPTVKINSILEYSSAPLSTGMGAIVFGKTNAIDGETGGYTSFIKKPPGASQTEGMRLTEEGILHIVEPAGTPTAMVNSYAFYGKSDNMAYFQDGAGAEHAIQLGSTDYGEMGNAYGSNATEVIRAADEVQAMFHANIDASSPHLNSGFTFTAGLEATISSIADNGGVVAGTVLVTTGVHGLSVGDYITQNACADANYNGIFTVLTVPTTSTYTVTATWGATGTGYAQMGSYLECNTTGIYDGMWHASYSQSVNATHTWIISPYVNTIQSTKAVSERALDNNTDKATVGGNGLMSFVVGDRIWFASESSVAQTLTVYIRNIAVK